MGTWAIRTTKGPTRRRRAPTLRVQLLLLAAVIGALVAASFAFGNGDEPPSDTTPGTAAPLTTVTSAPPGFPPASERSVCRTLLTTTEAEALVGRPLEEDVIEPRPRQCAWPLEEGTPLDAELFLVVKEREDQDLASVLRHDWEPDRFRLDPVTGLGDDAAYVVRRPDPDDPGTEEFVVGLDVHSGGLHVVLGNGARDIWDGGVDAVKVRLRAAMGRVLERIDEHLGGG